MAAFDLLIPILLLVTLVLGAYYWFKVRGGYKVRVIIWEPRGNGWLKRYDQGKRFKVKGGETFYRLKKSKMKISPPAFVNLSLVEGGKNELELYSPTPGHFIPVKFEAGVLKPLDSEIEFWRSVEVEKEQLRFRKDGWLERYGWLMALVMIVMVFGITTYIVYDGINKVAQTNAGVAAANAEVITKLDKILNGGTATSVGVNTPAQIAANNPPAPPF